MLGLSRITLRDLPVGFAGVLPNRVRVALGPPDNAPQPPIMDPNMTLAEIRAQTQDLIPGARVRRHIYWRHSMIYPKPQGA